MYMRAGLCSVRGIVYLVLLVLISLVSLCQMHQVIYTLHQIKMSSAPPSCDQQLWKKHIPIIGMLHTIKWIHQKVELNLLRCLIFLSAERPLHTTEVTAKHAVVFHTHYSCNNFSTLMGNYFHNNIFRVLCEVCEFSIKCL